MIENKRILSFIGAREGSKGLPGKNVKDFAGKPLIAWTIGSSIASTCIDFTFVSTDGEEIAEIAKKYGAHVPFFRPKELASDTSNIYDAIRHSILALENIGESFDYVVLLQPTQPLRTKNFLDNFIRSYFSKAKSEFDSMITVKEVDPKYNLIMRLQDGEYLKYFLERDQKIVNRQDLQSLFLVSGVAYIASVKKILSGKRYDDEPVLHYLTDELESSDIDTIEDFHEALKNFEILKSQDRI
ncbi:N-Acetylneuraminate cytidylyltransferase [Leptospira ryugenii]|uniref:N-Acetylneuraminate cytidylyltransferase n=1 Tax=Leptospira ryugenii TaxID=1917863 RepID=A0A2P2DW12_9LEPT|nr:acylneuraminate cytidylyltransferase family protein [Leptospira ryugenii]GBF48822.1 N-Acetylneuraminate cytidylyltransferase [Leptospira ryugenii]